MELEERKNAVKKAALLTLVMAVAMLGALSYIESLQKRHSALQAQIADWQKAAALAHEIRGWQGKVHFSVMEPAHLVDALNPCQLEPEGEILNTEICAKALSQRADGPWVRHGLFPTDRVEIVLK
jgi:hypothetical protein